MEQIDTRETESEEIDRALADIAESPSAIERQIAAAAALREGNYAPQAAAGGFSADRRVIDYNTNRREPRRVGLWIFLVLFLFIAAALILAFTDLGRPLQQAFSTTPQLAKQIAAIPSSLPATNISPSANSSTATNASATANPTPPTNNSPAADAPPTHEAAAANDSSPAINNPSPITNTSPTANNSAPTNNASPATNPPPASEPQTTAPKNVAEAANAAALSVPITDVSLRNRPELLEQLVPIYRAQLASDPKNTTAQNALNQLRERSLSELESIIAAGDDSATVKSLALASRLFPELTDNPRYRNLIARMDNIHREQKPEQTAKAEPSTPAATKPSTKSVAPAIAASAAVAKKSSENAVSSKPEIRAVSITPGTMVDGRFVPRDGGNVFMVELSYSNFSKAFLDKDEATLVAQLSVPQESLVLAEVPVVISADRGTKSFAMETTGAQGYAGGKFQLEFLLNDEYLTSRTVRLSLAGQ